MSGLKRLSGAKAVSQDDFVKGCGTYIVTFDAPPTTSVASVKKELGKFKLDEVKLKITVTAPEGDKIGELALAGDACLKELKELKGKKVVLSGVLTDKDEEGKSRLLTLSKVAEAK